ncbi:MAG TPA: N-acylglucosamine 2-epimerase, partial [bacterium]|nr:N-acylglucosamine 2-epimerase [bacterium]
MEKSTVESCLEESQEYFQTKLLPFWLDRCKDTEHGGFLTHFDQDGRDSGEDEKSMLAQARTIYSM